MNQSGTIAATLLAGFVLYLAARDRLKVYAAVLWGDTEAPLPSHSKTIPGFGVSPAGGAGGGSTGLLEGLTGAGGTGGLLEAAPMALEAAGPLLLL